MQFLPSSTSAFSPNSQRREHPASSSTARAHNGGTLQARSAGLRGESPPLTDRPPTNLGGANPLAHLSKLSRVLGSFASATAHKPAAPPHLQRTPTGRMNREARMDLQQQIREKLRQHSARNGGANLPVYERLHRDADVKTRKLIRQQAEKGKLEEEMCYAQSPSRVRRKRYPGGWQTPENADPLREMCHKKRERLDSARGYLRDKDRREKLYRDAEVKRQRIDTAMQLRRR